MSRIYKSIGSLSTLKAELSKNDIHEFNSVRSLIDFQNSFHSVKEELLAKHSVQIEREKVVLEEELNALEMDIKLKKEATEQQLIQDINSLQKLISSLKEQQQISLIKLLQGKIKLFRLTKLLQKKKRNFQSELLNAVSQLSGIQYAKLNRLQFINANFKKAVETSASDNLISLERKMNVLKSLNSLIYGAIGEHKVLKYLEGLSDDYFVINDVNLPFSPALYYSQEKGYFKSIQIDHVVVSPAGIFLIETKNWSEKSTKNSNLRSPVEQIRRASFAVFSLLSKYDIQLNIGMKEHHWGELRVPIKSILVFTGFKPIEEFQFVKILGLNELLGYIQYFKPVFNPHQVKRITDFLLQCDGSELNCS